MPRFFWISASIAVLVIAFAVLAMAVPGIEQMDAGAATARHSLNPDTMRVVTYEVPPARGEEISQTLTAVLLNNGGESVQPLGQARLAAPGRLMVSAPASMHDSIGHAIKELSLDEQAAVAPMEGSAVDVWLLEAQDSAGTNDPRLAPVKPLLDAARQRFSHGHYKVLDRGMVVAQQDFSQSRVAASRFQARVQIHPLGEAVAEAQIYLEVNDQGGPNRFDSRIPLPDGQWQLVGLMPGGAANAPERLLLMRQTPVSLATPQGQ